MRRIIKGKTYNIDTADEVHIGEVVGGGSTDWWGLYRKRNGEFFKVTFSSDGQEVRGVDPMTDGAARKLLEAFAPKALERHFGANPTRVQFEKKITIRVSATLASRLEELASSHGLSLNAYAAKYLARCLHGEDFMRARAEQTAD